ncbi:MFS transporter [Actinoplanes sp. L3-i22]|uniref:MFS transporter n=1 Tax=Actinoplanes sp. L3-i22 TaxID=2836373 RepID=UPI001C78B674|nr:MFS transporter [Actinoplanes sp. L3-i22]BCY11144.1 putative drug antiporter protein precursor [Actinoplanes sp. L3-i22]
MRWRGLSGVLSSQACTLSANRLLTVAVPWLVLDRTGSAAQTGLVVACQVLPYAFTQWLAGPLLDRIGPRRISVAGDVTSAAVLIVPAILGTPPLWLLTLMLLIVGCADGPASAAKRLLVPFAAADAGQSTVRGVGLATAVERTATAVGTAMAGWLVATLGGDRALWVAATMLGVATVIVTMTVTDPVRDRGRDDETYLDRLRTGTTFLRGSPPLRALTAMFVVTNLLDQALMAVLLPVWARSGGHDATVVGLALSTVGLASIASALASAGFGTRLPRRATYLIGVLSSGPTRILVLALGLPPEVVIAVYALAGIGSGLFNPLLETLQVERIPAALRGRVQTLISAWAWAGIPIGGLFGAALLNFGGLTTALWICGLAYLAAVLRPAWRVDWSIPVTAEPIREIKIRLAPPEVAARVPVRRP